MAIGNIEEAFADVLRRDSFREKVYGEYHPSTVTGCSLKGFLDKMVDVKTPLNNYMFQGSAVHHYAQESGLLTRALSKAGYHPLDTEYEVSTHHKLGDGIKLTGTCDVLTHGDEGVLILDLKYSSVRPETHQGRLFQYMSQVNTYAFMFGADEYGLLLIYAYANDNQKGGKPTNIPDSILVIPGEPSDDNWNLVTSKARSIHKALGEYGYPEGERWTHEGLEKESQNFWDSVLSIIDKNHAPSYEKECNYCDHNDYCPVYNSGLKGMGR